MGKTVFKNINLNLFLPILIALVLLLPLFFPILSAYFSQDDFYHLRMIMDKNLADIPSFFVTWQEGQTFYRPLSREVFNLLMFRSFGLNPVPFHIVNFLLIIINCHLIFLFVQKFINNKTVAILSLILYALSSIHSIELYYLASVQILLATVFILLSILCFPLFDNIFSIKRYLTSISLFVLALLSHESALVLPMILVILTLILNKQSKKIWNKQVFISLGFFIFLGIAYLFLSSLFKNLPQQQLSYQPNFSIKSIFNTLSWYILWSFNFPEMLADFIGPKFTINPNLMKYYGPYFKLVISLFLGVILFLTYVFIKYKNKLFREKFFFVMVMIYLVSLIPFLFFPQHKFIYYLSLPIVWFSISLAIILDNALAATRGIKFMAILALVFMVIISYQTIQLNKITHWAAKRSNAAKYLLENIKKDYPKVKKGTIFYFTDDESYPDIAKEWGKSSKQAFYILSGADALKLLYSDLTINTFFEGMTKLPVNIDPKNVIRYTAKFPY